jgi:hypothetical protein
MSRLAEKELLQLLHEKEPLQVGIDGIFRSRNKKYCHKISTG